VDLIRRHLRVVYHPDHVGRLLRACGFTRQRPQPRANECDDRRVRDWIEQEWPRVKKLRRLGAHLHRLFAYISSNWRGRSLASRAVIVNLIAATSTAARLRVRCELDRRADPNGQAVTDAQMGTVRLAPHRFHGDWDDTIHLVPRHR
jgi:hypothetical protein